MNAFSVGNKFLQITIVAATAFKQCNHRAYIFWYTRINNTFLNECSDNF